jgi:hypothetical protein
MLSNRPAEGTTGYLEFNNDHARTLMLGYLWQHNVSAMPALPVSLQHQNPVVTFRDPLTD